MPDGQPSPAAIARRQRHAAARDRYRELLAAEARYQDDPRTPDELGPSTYGKVPVVPAASSVPFTADQFRPTRTGSSKAIDSDALPAEVSAGRSDVVEIELENGAIVEFPASMSADQITAAIEGGETRPQPSLLNRAIPTAMRVGGAVSGAVLGSVVPGAGTLVGGGAGAGLGEYAAEQFETMTGQREDINPLQVGVQAAIGAIPLGRVPGASATAEQLARYAASLPARRAVQGAALGGGAAVATELAETGELPSLGELALPTAAGAVLGGVGGRVERAPIRARAAEHAAEEAAAAVTAQASRRALPPGPAFVVMHDGTIVPAGAEMPMERAPDGSYVRAVPGEYARREVRGELAPVRGYVADEAGRVVPTEESARLTEAPPLRRGPDASGVRSVPAAIADREFDGARVTREIYSSDPSAVTAPKVQLSETEARELRRMAAELESVPFTPRSFNYDIARQGGSPEIVAGAAGAPVYDDIIGPLRYRPTRSQVLEGVNKMLAGEHNALGQEALEVARLRLAGDRSVSRPFLPPEAGDVPTSRALTAAADEGFDRFATEVDAVAAEAAADPRQEFAAFGRMFDEGGFITSTLAVKAGGATAGAATGAASGDTPEERYERALVGALAGFGAGAALSRVGARRGGQTPAARGPADVVRMSTAPEVTRASSTAQGQPLQDPLRGVEPFLRRFSNPLVRDGVLERLTVNGGFAEQRRNAMSAIQLGALAEKVRVDVSRVLPKGTAVNAETVTAYARAVQRTQERASALATKVTAGTATDAEILTLQAARADADVILKSMMGLRAEAGRSLAMFRLFDQVLETGDVKLIRGVVDAPGVRKETQQFAAQLTDIKGPVAQYEFLRAQKGSTLGDKVRGYYYANILSGVKTHERNILGNLANGLTHLVVQPAAVAADVARAATTGAPRSMFLGELPHQVAGALAGFERGWQDAWFALRHGVSPDALRTTVSAATSTGKFDLPRVEFKGGALNPFNVPGRALDAADTFFRSIARNQELYGSAFAAAKGEGLKSQRLLARVAELRSGITPEGQALRVAAEDVAARAVFQEKPGEITNSILNLTRSVPGLWFVLPFVKTPAAILRQGLEFSPAGALMKGARQGGRAGAQAQARTAVGSMAAGFVAWLAATGRLSGDGPRDRTERAALMEKGWRPNSVKIGDHWVGYQLFQPLSVPMSIIANGYESWQADGGKPKAAEDIAAQTLARSVNSFLDQSFLSGLFDFIEALKDPERSASRVAGRTASSLIPLSGAVRTVQQAADPVVRQPRGISETVKAGVPRLSEEVPARLSRFGEDVRREGGPLRRAADPFNVSTERKDPVADELDRLDIALTLPSDNLKLPEGRELTKAEAEDLRRTKGKLVREALAKAIEQPGYRLMTDEQRRRLLERRIEGTRQTVNKLMRAKFINAGRATTSAVAR